MTHNSPTLTSRTWSREFQYLLAACQSSSIQEEALVQPASSSLDWHRIQQLAIAHRVLPQLHQHLSRTGDPQCPAEVRTSVHAKAKLLLHRSLFLTAELIRIVGQFENAGIHCLTLKGPSLAKLAYGNASSRTFNDIDILVSEADFLRATTCLAGIGYRSEKNLDSDQQLFQIRSKGEILFSNSNGGFVDLHASLNRGTYAYRTTWEQLWSGRQLIELQDAQLPTLGPSELLLYLAIHGAKHRWSQLNWILDFARAMKICDLEQAFSTAKRIGEQKVLELGVMVCEATFGTDQPLRIKPDRRQAALLAELSRHLELGTASDDRISELLYLYKARQRPMAAVLATLAEITKPHLTDWNAVRLPRMLWFGYALIRPMRLLWKRLRKLA